jgi:hypothetical protein
MVKLCTDKKWYLLYIIRVFLLRIIALFLILINDLTTVLREDLLFSLILLEKDFLLLL